jgi:hypothetical protein
MASMVKAHWCMAAMPSPKGTAVEQLAGITQTTLGRQFGLVALQFGPRAFKQNYCPDNALQLSFREQGH